MPQLLSYAKNNVNEEARTVFVSGAGSSRTETEDIITLDGDCFEFPSAYERPGLISLDKYDGFCSDGAATDP